jgi:hypothetical protein
MEDEVVADPIVETPAAPESAPAPSEPAPVEASSESPLAPEPEVDAEGKPVVAAFTPTSKVRVMDEDVEIPKEIQGFMKDKESEKVMLDLFTKAKGLDFAKQRAEKLAQQSEGLNGENTRMKSAIGELKSTYQTAVRTQNWLKLDDFFQKLDIPKEHIFAYAVAHAQLSQMDPVQKQQVMQTLEADRRADMLASQQAGTQSAFERQVRDMKRMEIEITFAQPTVSSAAQDFDAKVGKPGAFRDLVLQQGELEWVRSGGKVNLPVQQAVDRVMKNYGLQAGQASPTAMGVAGTSAVPGKPVVQQTSKTIPNMGGKGTSSPLKTKPRSVEDLQKIYASMSAGE